MYIYKVGTKMKEKLIKSALTKLINSDVIYDVYPMVDHIDVKNISLVTGTNKTAYALTIDIIVNDSLMTKENMFDLDFDPHWLVDKYIVDLSKYLSISIYNVFFTVHNLEGDLIYEWFPF